MRSVVSLLCGALLLLPSSALGQKASDVETAIHRGTAAWAAAWNAGDAAGIAVLYADDAVVMAPGAEPAKGRAAIQAAMMGALAATGGSQMKIEPLEIMTGDGMAVEVGRFVETAADGSHRDHGRYVAVWKNVSGEWRLYRDIWNSSM